VGGVVPKQYIPGVEKGSAECLQEGVVAGYPVVDIKVVLFDGSYHPVDSSDMSFQLAASHATRNGLSQAGPVLLEPIYFLQVTVPDAFVGDIMSDLNSRRGRVMGTNPQDGLTVIEALVPQAELVRYSLDLRALTQGRGTFMTEFQNYEEVPANVAQRVVAEAKKEMARV
jgi:elongation factor G